MKKINIVFAVDEIYFHYAVVSIESIIENIGDTVIPCFWLIVTETVSDGSKRFLELLLNDKAEIKFLDAMPYFNSFGISNHHEVQYVSSAMYLRLQIPRLLPKSIERALYLDADILCTNKLAIPRKFDSTIC